MVVDRLGSQTLCRGTELKGSVQLLFLLLGPASTSILGGDSFSVHISVHRQENMISSRQELFTKMDGVGLHPAMANIFCKYSLRVIWFSLQRQTQLSHDSANAAIDKMHVDGCVCANKTLFTQTSGGPDSAHETYFPHL